MVKRLTCFELAANVVKSYAQWLCGAGAVNVMMRFSPCDIVVKRYQQNAVALVELGGVGKRHSAWNMRRV